MSFWSLSDVNFEVHMTGRVKVDKSLWSARVELRVSVEFETQRFTLWFTYDETWIVFKYFNLNKDSLLLSFTEMTYHSYLKKHKILLGVLGENQTNTRVASSDETAKFLDLLLMFIISAGLSFRTVENVYFRGMCDLLMKANAQFTVPKRRALKALARKKAEDKRCKIKKILDEVEDVSVFDVARCSTRVSS